jgi:hypothetical protein
MASKVLRPQTSVEPAVEQRQPMLHAGRAPAFAHRVVEHVVGRKRPECRHVTQAEAPDVSLGSWNSATGTRSSACSRSVVRRQVSTSIGAVFETDLWPVSF